MADLRRNQPAHGVAVPVSRDAVHVEGLAELRKALAYVDKDLPKNLRKKLIPIAQKVAERARQGMPVRSGRAKASVKGSVSGNNVYVQGGKGTVPYYGWLDFGGRLKPVGDRHNTQMRPVIRGGRYLYPAIDAMRPETEAAAVNAFVATAHDLRLMAEKH